MCRLFASLSTEPVDGRASLRALRHQGHVDPKRRQADGWGVGWIGRAGPHLLKSPKPIYADPTAFARAAKRARGRALVGHVRWASNPLKLPKRLLIGLPHTQPFVAGDWLFAHNGTLYIPKEVAAALPARWSRQIRGRNDSEVLFYWLMAKLGPLLRRPAARHSPARLAQGVRGAIRGLDRIWRKCRRRYPIYRFGYHGLNWVLTNGETLIAFCYVNPKGFDRGKALCSAAAYFQLRYRASRNAVCVASEPLDAETSWRAMKHGEILVARQKSNAIELHTRKIL